MKEAKGLFSKDKKGSKKENKCRESNLKNKYLEPMVVIITSCLFVLGIILAIKSFTNVESNNITQNSGEQLYYEGKYDEAIEEYKKMQENNDWPEWTVKIADIYSLKGEFEKSNILLKEAVVKRDKLIKNEGYGKLKDKDIELIKSIITTLILNGEYDEAVSFGNQYIENYEENKEILKTMFVAYVCNNDIDKAEEIIKKYPLDENSAYDFSVLANMNMILDRWSEAVGLLKKAFELDSNELKIYYVIENGYMLDKDSLIEALESEIHYYDDISYKVFLGNVYAMNVDTSNEAFNLIDELDRRKIDNFGTDYIKYKFNDTLNNKDEAITYLDNAISKVEAINKNSYTSFYLLSLKSIIDNKYDEALNYAQKANNIDSKYSEVYGILIPKILAGKNSFTSIEAYYREAIKKELYNYQTIINLANYYKDSISNNERAIYYYELVLKFREDNDLVISDLINSYIKEDKIDEAIEKLEESISTNEENRIYYRTLGALYLEKGMYEEGIEFTRKAYSMDEKDPISLNNAAWYYIFVENDIQRGYNNMKSAYDDMKAGLDEDIKEKLIENYTAVKKIYEEFLKDSNKTFNKNEMNLIY